MAREPRDRPWIETGPGRRFIRAALWVGLVLAATGLVLGLAIRVPWWQLALDCAIVASLVALLVMNRPDSHR